MPRSKSLDHPQPQAATDPAGRAEMTLDQLPIAARLRLEHAEKWVAWAPDDQSIIASGDIHKEVREAARLVGHPDAIMEWVPPVTGRIWE